MVQLKKRSSSKLEIRNFGPFTSIITELSKEGFSVARGVDLAQVVISRRALDFPFTGYISDVVTVNEGRSRGWTYDMDRNPVFMGENINYLPGNLRLVASREYNPLIPNITEACLKEGEGSPLFLNGETVNNLRQIAEEDKQKPVEKRRILIFSPKSETPYKIPTNRLTEEELPLFVFKELTKPYGLALRDLGMNEFTIAIPPLEQVRRIYSVPIESPFARPLALGGLSGIYGLERLNPTYAVKTDKYAGFRNTPIGLVLLGVR